MLKDLELARAALQEAAGTDLGCSTGRHLPAMNTAIEEVVLLLDSSHAAVQVVAAVHSVPSIVVGCGCIALMAVVAEPSLPAAQTRVASLEGLKDMKVAVRKTCQQHVPVGSLRMDIATFHGDSMSSLDDGQGKTLAMICGRSPSRKLGISLVPEACTSSTFTSVSWATYASIG